MKIGITVDGKPLDMKTAHEWVYNETGVLHGTDLVSSALADALHQGFGAEERVLLSEKGLHQFINTIAAQAVIGVYLRSCLLLEQIENPKRKRQLNERLLECYPSRGFSSHEDKMLGYGASPSPEEQLIAAIKEQKIYYKAEGRLGDILQDWVDDDDARGSPSSTIYPENFELII